MRTTLPIKVGELDLLIETKVVQVPGSEPTSASDRAVQHLSDAFDRAQLAIGEIAVATAKTIARTTERAACPSSVEVEFGLSVSAKGDIIVAGASAEATLRVTITYEAKPGQTPASENA